MIRRSNNDIKLVIKVQLLLVPFEGSNHIGFASVLIHHTRHLAQATDLTRRRCHVTASLVAAFLFREFPPAQTLSAKKI
jgi:hypothetical protein